MRWRVVLGLANNAEPLAHQGVHERGLAHWACNNAHEAGAVGFWFRGSRWMGFDNQGRKVGAIQTKAMAGPNKASGDACPAAPVPVPGQRRNSSPPTNRQAGVKRFVAAADGLRGC
jgi:hypothetical protein